MDLYYHIIPPPSRAVLVLAKMLNIKLNLISIDTRDPSEMDILTKVNPLQSLPTLIDDGQIVGESHTVLIHLTTQFDKKGTLYPPDLKIRSAINECLFFDTNMYKCFVSYSMPTVIKRQEPNQELLEKLLVCIRALDVYLKGRTYAAGNRFTLADLSLAHTIASLEVIKVKLADFPNIERWLQKALSEMPEFGELHTRAEEALHTFLAKQYGANRA
ncbi:glutathione S-transferase 1-like [Ochlerotatus camptorhynchus]|uniref:glutathione S-transferase 1-like n=1 Tax=Ochlerotatus camptorhynchus TaxID=644619 RepID=UPI0031E00319